MERCTDEIEVVRGPEGTEVVLRTALAGGAP